MNNLKQYIFLNVGNIEYIFNILFIQYIMSSSLDVFCVAVCRDGWRREHRAADADCYAVSEAGHDEAIIQWR